MSWSSKYLGTQYASCIHLVQAVVDQEFGIKKNLPYIDNHAYLMECRTEWARRVPPGQPLRDGMVVLLRPDSPVMHAGVLCLKATEPSLLHVMTAPGPAVLQSLRILGRVMKIEGIYEVLP